MSASVEFTGKVVVVTGGTSGIGLATCVAFAKKGCKVVLNDYSEDSREKALQDVLSASQCPPDALLFVQGDVSKEEDVVGLLEKAVAAFGKIDILVNNAGRAHAPVPFEEISSEEFADIMHVNCFGVFYGMKHGIKQMKSQPVDQGPYYIINMSSIAGRATVPNYGGYSASKHAIIGMTRVAAKEVYPAGIRVTAICPGMVETPMGSQHSSKEVRASLKNAGLLMQPEEIANAVIYACSNPYMTGHALVIDAGFTA